MQGQGGYNGTGLQAPVHTSTVVVTAIVYDDRTVSMDLTFQHVPSDPDDKLLGVALSVVRQNGGVMVDSGGTVDFYPLMSIKKLTFKVNRVIAASNFSPNEAKIRLQ